MADTRAASGLTVQQWDKKFFNEHVQSNRFAKYAGVGENNMIQVKEDLKKKKGESVTFSLINRLKNSATTGTNTLEGNEEDLTSRSYKLTVTKRRNAVRTAEMDDQKSAIDLRKAAKPTLMTWAMEDYRDLIIQALGSVNGVAYGSATEVQKDAWLADNADRVLFGASKSNNSGNDHSASLANVDGTSDKLTSGALSLMKRMAAEASPKVKPVKIIDGSDEEWFVVFVTPRAMRDLKTDATITAAQRETVSKMQNNRLFRGGDVEWDGMIIRQIDDIEYLTGVGASSIDVGPVYLCGAQAIGVGIAKRWKSVTQTFDYGDKVGTAVEQIYGVDKLEFGTGDDDDLTAPVDHGIVTGFFAAVADA